MIQKISTDDPDVCRAISGNPDYVSVELYQTAPNGHKYSVGETRTLTGLEDFPEYNGQEVKITAIREDGPHGKTYYIEGKINEMINWVYEYRLI